MRLGDEYRHDIKNVMLNVAAQLIWVVVVALAAAVATYVFSTTDLTALWQRQLAVPAWAVLLSSLIGLVLGVLMFYVTRRASVVRGRVLATDANVKLLASRRTVNINERLVRSTRFGRWPAGERLQNRSDFREELDKAILEEGIDVRRIWNLSSVDDVVRLREILAKYKGQDNHSIRAYFGLPDFVMPELLIVERRGASISFPSTRTPHGMDWMIRFKRPYLVHVVRDYFDVLWDRGERILDAGEVVPSGQAALAEFEASLKPTNPRS